MEVLMSKNGPDFEAMLLGQIYFALDAEGFAMFPGLVDKPPSATANLRRTLTSPSRWCAKAVGTSKCMPGL